jgi:hypothetical protein
MGVVGRGGGIIQSWAVLRMRDRYLSVIILGYIQFWFDLY